MVVCGRVFPHDVLQRINAAVRDHPEWSRADVARRVCDWLDWRAATGKRKEVNCRVALVRLERRGLIALPPPRRRVRFSGSRFAATRLNVPERLEGSVHELCKLELVLVNSKDRERDWQWKKLVSTHHYLGYRPLCGAQLRYLISCEHGYVGALGFSAAALYLKARDRWIGWSHAARQAYLRYVVANSRFVIARQVKVVNLASKVLAMAQKRLAKDWQQAYGYRPLLLETYVESKRFAATCYRAANWIYVGRTRGRGRQDRDHRACQPIKDIYLHALDRDCRQRLCEEPGPARRSPTRSTKPPKPPHDWAEEEFGAIRLRDGRHRERLFTVARDFYAQPAANIPQACQSRAKTKAAYRLFKHKAVSMNTILCSHYDSTMERIAREKIKVVLAVQDTTSFNYDAHAAMEELGPINTHVDGAQESFCMTRWPIPPRAGPGVGRRAGLGARCAGISVRSTRSSGPSRKRRATSGSRAFRRPRACSASLGRPVRWSVWAIARPTSSSCLTWRAASRAPQAFDSSRARPARHKTLAHALGSTWNANRSRAQRLLHMPRRKGESARACVLNIRFAQVELRPPKLKPFAGTVKSLGGVCHEIDRPGQRQPWSGCC